MHVLSVSSLKGGVGKTTVALGLASAAFASSLRTLVIDLDSQCDATTGLGVGEDSATTVLEVLQNPRHNVVLSSIVPSPWANGRKGFIDVMAGNSRSSSYDSVTTNIRDIWKLEEALSQVESQYDLVIIDTPPSLGGLLRTAWAASDRVLIVAEPGIFAVGAVERSLKAVAEMHDTLNDRLAPVGVIVNRSQPNFVEHGFRNQEIKDRVGDFYIEVELLERAAMQQAQGAARPIHSWPGEGAAELSSAFDELLTVVRASFKDEVTRSQRRRDRHNVTHKNKWFRSRSQKRDYEALTLDNLDE